MLENILSVIQGPVQEFINGNSSVPADKKSKTIETTVGAFADGLKQNITPDNISQIASLFGKASASSSSNPILKSIEGVISSALVSKVGLSQPIATMISSQVIPVITKVISSQSKDSKGGLDLESMLGSLAGSGGGGLLGSLGKLFK